MEKTYTEKELLEMGFQWQEDWDESYMIKVDDPEDYFWSKYSFSEKVGDNKYLIRRG